MGGKQQVLGLLLIPRSEVSALSFEVTTYPGLSMVEHVLSVSLAHMLPQPEAPPIGLCLCWFTKSSVCFSFFRVNRELPWTRLFALRSFGPQARRDSGSSGRRRRGKAREKHHMGQFLLVGGAPFYIFPWL